MYNTGAAMGEKTSKEQRVTATEQQESLTPPQIVALRTESPHLRHFKAIATILIKFPID
jgi:hypothetical protein